MAAADKYLVIGGSDANVQNKMNETHKVGYIIYKTKLNPNGQWNVIMMLPTPEKKDSSPPRNPIPEGFRYGL
jgi:hypothetical protein